MYNQGATDADQLAQMRYMAILQRRSAPPRCNPISILVLVMSLGMVFIGLTMTVIAHWPGSTSIGENPLKIAGPVLLSVGGALFICGMFLVCFLNRKEKKRWAKSVNNLAQSRLTLNQSASSLPGAKGVPKSGQKGNTSVAPVRGYETGYAPPPDRPTDSSGSQRYPSFNYAEDTSDSGKKAGLIHGHVESGQHQVAADMSSNGDHDLPDPIRARKKKKGFNSSSENLNSPEREGLLNSSALGQPKPPDYSQSDEDVFNLSTDGDSNIPGAIRKKKKRGAKSSRENLNVSETEEFLHNSRDRRKDSHEFREETVTRVSVTKQYQTTYEDEMEATGKSSKPAPPPKKPKPVVPSKPATVSQVQEPSPGEARRLRVHVRTQPGAKVHIQQGTPPLPSYSSLNKSTGSAETDL